MNASVQSKCELILKNRNMLKKSMFWEVSSNTYAIMAALITAAKGVNADADQYKANKKTIRKNINFFSAMRGYTEAVLATKMLLETRPEEYIQGVQEVYKKLRSIHKLTASAYMVMAAMNIYEHSGVGGADADIEKLEVLYKTLKKAHPLLTWDEDRGYLSMLIASDISPDALVDEIEKCYKECKKVALSKDAVHSLAQVLSLSSKSAEEKGEFVRKMLAGLKENKKPISKSYGLTAIGALALLDVPAERLIQDIIDADNYLKGQKGFKWYNEGKRLRMVYSTLAVFMSYAGEEDSQLSSCISANIAVEIAIEIVIMIIIMMQTSASNASSSSSSNS